MTSKTTKPKDAAKDPTPDESQAGTPDPEAAAEETTLEEYEQNRVELLAKLAAAIEERGSTPVDITSKLALITGLVGQVRKTGQNTFHKYRYAKEGDLTEAIRPLLSALGIRVHESLYGDPDKGFVPHERRSQLKGKDAQQHEAETLTVITMVFWFEHYREDTKQLEKTEPQIFVGYGDDNGDKGIYKALTGTVKYFLMKSFMVATGDDPEGDSRSDQRADARTAQASTRVDVRQSERQGQTQHGGRQQETSRPQAKQLGDLLKARGVKTSTDALTFLGERLGQTFAVEDGDPATTLATVIAGIAPNVMGKLLYDLRKEAEGGTPPQEFPPAAGEAGWKAADAPEGGVATPEQPEAGSGEAATVAAAEAPAEEDDDAGPIV